MSMDPGDLPTLMGQNRQKFGDETQPQNYETLLVLTKSCIESRKRKTIADVSIQVILLLLDDRCSGGCDDGMLLRSKQTMIIIRISSILLYYVLSIDVHSL